MPWGSWRTFTCKTRRVRYFSFVMSRFHGASRGHLCADTSARALHGWFYESNGAEQGQSMLSQVLRGTFSPAGKRVVEFWAHELTSYFFQL